MKIALLTYEYEPSIGGIGTGVKQTALALAARGHEVHVICPDYGLPSTDLLPDDSHHSREAAAREVLGRRFPGREIPGRESSGRRIRGREIPVGIEESTVAIAFVLRFPAMRRMGSPIDMLRAAWSIRKTLRIIRPDWVLLMDLHAQLQAGILTRLGQPLASTGTAGWFHGSELHHLRVGKLARAFGVPAIDRCRVLFVNSHDTLDRVKRMAPQRWLAKATLGGVGVSPEFLSAARDAEAERRLRDRWDIPNYTRVLLTVARLVARKGIDRSLEAVAADAALRSRCRYVIVGTGPSEGELRRQAKRLGLDEIVRFTGAVESSDLMTFYDIADLYVQASRTVGGDVEGLGVSYLEAAARSVPSVGFRHGGVPEAVKDGSTGILVDEDDVTALTAALNTLLRDETRRTTMGRAARSHVQEHFQWSLVAERVEHALRTNEKGIGAVGDPQHPIPAAGGAESKTPLRRNAGSSETDPVPAISAEESTESRQTSVVGTHIELTSAIAAASRRVSSEGRRQSEPRLARTPEPSTNARLNSDLDTLPLDIVVVSSRWPPLHTGAGLQAKAMLKCLGKAVQVRVLTIGFRGAARREESDGFLIERMGSIETARPARDFGAAAAARLSSIRPPQLLWVLGVGPAAYSAILVGRMRRIPVLVKLTLEGQDDTDTLRRKSAGSVRIRLLRSTTLVCPSTRLRRLALEMGFPPDRVVHIPNGVDLSRFTALPRERDPAQIAFVGVMLERKGLHIVLEALEELIADHPMLRLVVMGEWIETGEPAQHAYVERLRARLAGPLSPHVTVLGAVDHPEEWLARSSIFVLPSESEGLPNALLEAMAAGAVPVVSDLPSVHEVVSDRRNGLVVREQSPQAWAEAIGSLLRDPGSIGTMSQEARATVRDHYDLAGVARSYLDLFRRVARR